MNNWISVKDRLPEDEADVLAFTDEGIIQASYDSKQDNPYKWQPITLDWHGCGCCGGDRPTITHWMPLPLPPKPENQ